VDLSQTHASSAHVKGVGRPPAALHPSRGSCGCKLSSSFTAYSKKSRKYAFEENVKGERKLPTSAPTSRQTNAPWDDSLMDYAVDPAGDASAAGDASGQPVRRRLQQHTFWLQQDCLLVPWAWLCVRVSPRVLHALPPTSEREGVMQVCALESIR